MVRWGTGLRTAASRPAVVQRLTAAARWGIGLRPVARRLAVAVQRAAAMVRWRTGRR